MIWWIKSKPLNAMMSRVIFFVFFLAKTACDISQYFQVIVTAPVWKRKNLLSSTHKRKSWDRAQKWLPSAAEIELPSGSWDKEALDSLYFPRWLGAFVPQPGFSRIMMKYSSSVLNYSNISQLFFPLAPSFVLIRTCLGFISCSFWKEADSSTRSIHVAAQ